MNYALLYPSMGTLFSLTLTNVVSPIWRLVELTSVETNAPAGGIVGDGVGISLAADFARAAAGIAMASKHSSAIEILMLFDNMMPLLLPIFKRQDYRDQDWMKVTCSLQFVE